MLLSIVVPCHNEQDTVPEMYRQCLEALREEDIQTEFVFIDDGSTDRTLQVFRDLAAQDERVKYISFSRNFGKEAAMYAGLCRASGDYTVIMDADLQDPPGLLPEMIAALRTGEYDCVATRRVDRKGEPVIRSFFARAFYKLIRRISDIDIVDGARDFRMMDRKVVDAIRSMKEYNRFSKGIFGWVGFRTKWLEYENVERAAGESNWSFWKLFRYAVDGIMNFSHMPLNIASGFGIVMTAVAFVILIILVLRKLMFGDPVAGWASTVCIMIFIGGVQLFCTGIMGQYVAKTFMEVKHRPIYLVSETNMEEK